MTSVTIDLIDAFLADTKHNSLIDGDRVRDLLLDLRLTLDLELDADRNDDRD